MTGRLVAVFGYSRGGGTLHPICASRLRRAEAETRPEDVVLLSGWSHHRRVRSEAELMAEVWEGPPVELVVSPDARTTLGNARDTASLARDRGLDEVVLVTSRWHVRRARALLRAALHGSDARVVVVPAEGPPARLARLREIACWALVPAAVLLARRAPRRSSPEPEADVRATPSRR